MTFYVNGAQVETITGLKSGYTIASGGTLVMAQDQDIQLGNWNTTQLLSGVLYDARVYSAVLASGTIASNYASDVAYNSSSLIANWKFNSLSTGNVVIDTVSGNNLTLGHASGTGYTANTPTLTLSVAENPQRARWSVQLQPRMRTARRKSRLCSRRMRPSVTVRRPTNSIATSVREPLGMLPRQLPVTAPEPLSSMELQVSLSPSARLPRTLSSPTSCRLLVWLCLDRRFRRRRRGYVEVDRERDCRHPVLVRSGSGSNTGRRIRPLGRGRTQQQWRRGRSRYPFHWLLE